MRARNTFIALPIAAAMSLALVACGEGPQGLGEHFDEVTEVVFTEGFPALPNILSSSFRIAFSTLEDATPSVGGSITTPVSLSGTGCDAFPAVAVIITYTVSGSQANAASFDVNTKWDYNGTTFVGSQPETVDVPAASGAPRTYEVPVSVENSAGEGAGSSSFQVAPFNLVTTGTVPGQRLSFDASATATVHVAFTECVAENTAPWITVPANRTLEATTAQGTANQFRVLAGDEEDGDLTDQVVCTPPSGSRFPIGETTVECSVTDSGGLEAHGSFTIEVVDTTPPTFIDPPGNRTLIATDIAGVTLDLADFAIDAKDWGPRGSQGGEISAPVAIDCVVGEGPDAPDADGYTVAIGQKVTIVCTATDARENASTHQFDVDVTLNLADNCGFGEGEPPLRFGFDTPLRITGSPSAHRTNSTIPHKACAPRYADGSVADDLATGLRLTAVHQGTTEIGDEEPHEFDGAGSTAWRFEEKDGVKYYIFNAKTVRSMKTGRWETRVTFQDLVVARTLFDLR